MFYSLNCSVASRLIYVSVYTMDNVFELVDLESPDGECSQSFQESMFDIKKETLTDIVLPLPPVKPEASDCCGSGCTPCVFDIYQDELKLWERECSRIQSGVTDCVVNSEEPNNMEKEKFNMFKLISVRKVTKDSSIYRFSLPATQSLGQFPAQHLVMRGVIGDRKLTRKYTLISPCGIYGYFDVLIKLYEHGKMSRYIRLWEEGDVVEWRGPFGQFTYSPNKFGHIGMLAAGTGITPMASVIEKVLDNEDDETLITLLYACRTYDDILLKPCLDEWSAFWNFKVIYILSKENDEHGCGKYEENILYGRIRKENIANIMPLPSSSVMILVCGTCEFDEDMIGYLRDLNYDPAQFFKF